MSGVFAKLHNSLTGRAILYKDRTGLSGVDQRLTVRIKNPHWIEFVLEFPGRRDKTRRFTPRRKSSASSWLCEAWPARVLARLSTLTEVVREIKPPLIRGTRWQDQKKRRRPKKEVHEEELEERGGGSLAYGSEIRNKKFRTVRGCRLLVGDSERGKRKTGRRKGGGGREKRVEGEWERRPRDKSRTRGDQIKVTNK